jgi:hypothetical protein
MLLGLLSGSLPDLLSALLSGLSLGLSLSLSSGLSLGLGGAGFFGLALAAVLFLGGIVEVGKGETKCVKKERERWIIPVGIVNRYTN